MAKETRAPEATATDRIPITELPNGHKVDLVVHRVHGAHGGPTLALFGGVHGDEPLSSEIVRRTVQSINPGALSGDIVAVPVANPYAYLALTRVTPLDGMNLNRIMPGDAAGSVTEQIANALARILTNGVSHLIDFHSGGNLACVDYSYIHEAGQEMSRAFGCRILYSHDSYLGSTTSFALEHGIRCMVAELGGGSQRIDYYLDRGVSGAQSAMRALGMLDGEPSRPPDDQVIVETLTVLRPRNGGVLLSEFDADCLGQKIPAGTTLGRIISPHTFEEVEEIRAPYDPSILVLTRAAVTNVMPGDYGFMVADGSTAKPAAT